MCWCFYVLTELTSRLCSVTAVCLWLSAELYFTFDTKNWTRTSLIPVCLGSVNESSQANVSRRYFQLIMISSVCVIRMTSCTWTWTSRLHVEHTGAAVNSMTVLVLIFRFLSKMIQKSSFPVLKIVEHTVKCLKPSWTCGSSVSQLLGRRMTERMNEWMNTLRHSSSLCPAYFTFNCG